MRITWAACWITAAVVASGPLEASAQWDWNKVRSRGMFGDRSLGEPIKPQPSSRFGNSFWRGPSGNFLGRDATRPGMMFPSPYGQNVYAPATIREPPPQVASRQMEVREPRAALPLLAAPTRPALPRGAPAPFEQPPEFEEAPEIWFRGAAPPGEMGETRLPQTPRTVAAGPGIALAGAVPPPTAAMPFGLREAGSVDAFLSSFLESQIARIPRFQGGEPIRVSVAGGVARIQGTVATQSDRKVLAEFIRMEPGVWDVNNELTVRP